MSPRIVVMMSCFNEGPYLRDTIPAVLAQSVQDLRLVILDNGSTDTSNAILDAYALFDRRITLLRADRNLQPGAVANLLSHVAMELWRDCDWFVAAGADDLMHPEYLAAVLKAAECHPHANVIFSPWRFIDGVKPDKYFPEFDVETCHAEHQIPAWSALRRDLIQVAGPWDREMIAADWDWVVRNRWKIRARQLPAPYISLRVRGGERKTQSDEVHWPSLHRHLCDVAGKPVPQWAQGCKATC